MFQVKLSKQRFKFSATHFTIFSEDRAEPLHGHNYRVSLSINFSDTDSETGLCAEFSELKQGVDEVCQVLDEKVLLPSLSPFLKIAQMDNNIEVQFKEKFYSFPISDCVVLDITNTSSECLSQWVYTQLKETLIKLGAKSFSVTLQETQGQAVTYSE